MSEKVCLKKKIDIAKNTLKHTEKQIEELEIGSPELRGHVNNGKLQQLSITKNRLENAIKIMEFDETNIDHVHVDKVDIESKPDSDSSYVI